VLLIIPSKDRYQSWRLITSPYSWARLHLQSKRDAHQLKIWFYLTRVSFRTSNLYFLSITQNIRWAPILIFLSIGSLGFFLFLCASFHWKDRVCNKLPKKRVLQTCNRFCLVHVPGRQDSTLRPVEPALAQSFASSLIQETRASIDSRAPSKTHWPAWPCSTIPWAILPDLGVHRWTWARTVPRATLVWRRDMQGSGAASSRMPVHRGGKQSGVAILDGPGGLRSSNQQQSWLANQWKNSTCGRAQFLYISFQAWREVDPSKQWRIHVEAVGSADHTAFWLILHIPVSFYAKNLKTRQNLW
jgi:hypothetical protein